MLVIIQIRYPEWLFYVENIEKSTDEYYIISGQFASHLKDTFHLQRTFYFTKNEMIQHGLKDYI
jgi:hypothetical protein